MITKEESTKILNFMTPGTGPYKLYCENAIFLFLWGMEQTNLVYSNDDQWRVYLNCKFHDSRGRGTCSRVVGEGKDRRGMVKIMYNNFVDVHIDCYGTNRLKCSFPQPLFIFFYSMIGMLCKIMSPSDKKSV